MIERTGAQILVDQLKIHGAKTVFCVPGESYLHVLDALYDASDSIRLISCRQEGGAAYAAEAYGKLTGQPGLCFVTRGPGATNASIGVHTAYQGATPMILFIGQVARGHTDREAFQEIDYRRMFGQMTKWVSQIDDARRIPEYVSRAFHLAVSGRPGPVALALPVDMLAERAVVPDAGSYRRARAAPAPDDMRELRAMLAEAERPLMMVGLGGWTPEAAQDIRAFAGANNLPSVAAFRSQDLIDNRAGYYLGATGVGGNPALDERVKSADFLLIVGARADELTTRGYTMIAIPRPKQKMVHVYPDPDELGRVYQADLLINATMPEFAAAAKQLPPLDGTRWAAWVKAGRETYVNYVKPTAAPGQVNFAEILAYLNKNVPANTLITNGAGNYTAWVHRFYEFSEPGTQVAPISGAMGYGVPAAIGAKLVYPERMVLAFAGDGCFLMNGQELATAVQYGLNIIFIVVNNNMLGTIRMHQERNFPGRVSGTTLVNPDFAAYARAFGAYGEVVERTEDFPAAFERALAARRPALIELRVDPEALTPNATLSGTREAALSRRR
jgi:acetolactate synthase-1/2/3 large subunit